MAQAWFARGGGWRRSGSCIGQGFSGLWKVGSLYSKRSGSHCWALSKPRFAFHSSPCVRATVGGIDGLGQD